ncbi:putative Casein kinase I isoform delta-like protein, partial [Naja naja]
IPALATTSVLQSAVHR